MLNEEELNDRVQGCIEMEQAMGALYEAYARVFAHDRELWTALSSDEDRHAEMLRTGADFGIFGIEDGQRMPPELPVLMRALAAIRAQLERIHQGVVDEAEAMHTALTLEQSAVEMFVSEVLTEEEDVIRTDLGTVIMEDREHLDTLRRLMVERGYSRLS
jgi:hypothetical protein